MMSKSKGVIFGALFLTMVCSPVYAGDWLLLGGAESDGQNNAYVYAGAVGSLPGARLGNGWHQRWWLDWLKYDYDSGDEEVSATAPGLQFTVGYQSSHSANTWALYGGLSHRNTRLSPDQPQAETRGNQTSLILLAEAGQELAHSWKLSQGAVADSAGNYWLRLKAGKRLGDNSILYGLSLLTLGGDEYRVNKVAATVDEIKISKDFAVNLGVGMSDTEGLGRATFALLEMVYVYIQ